MRTNALGRDACAGDDQFGACPAELVTFLECFHDALQSLRQPDVSRNKDPWFWPTSETGDVIRGLRTVRRRIGDLSDLAVRHALSKQVSSERIGDHHDAIR